MCVYLYICSGMDTCVGILVYIHLFIIMKFACLFQNPFLSFDSNENSSTIRNKTWLCLWYFSLI